MGKRALGIDIGTSSIKLVELEKTSDGIELLRTRLVELSASSDQSNRQKIIKEAIENLLKTEKIKSGRTALSLSGQSVFIRFLKLPKIRKGKIDKIIRYEAQQQVPFPLEKITWDHQNFGKAGDAEDDILFVAAKKDIVEETLEYLSKTSLDVELVDVSPLALLNTIIFNEPLKKGVILDIGAKATNLIILDEKGFWVRAILIAGEEMTHSIASKLNLPFDKAEELKKKEGEVFANEPPLSSNLSPMGKDMAGALNSVLADLTASIVQSLEFYRTKQNCDFSFEDIILTGGGSKLKGMENFLSKNLGMQIRRTNLAQKIKCPSSMRTDVDFQARFGAAIGLALRLIQRCPSAIDLLPAEKKAERDFRKNRIYVAAAGLLLSLIPLTIALNIHFRAGTFKSEFDSLNGLLAKYETAQKNISSLKNDIKKLEDKIRPFREMSEGKTFLLDALLEIDAALPLDAWITAFTGEKEFVTIEGRTTANFSTITEFKKKLESSALFESVEIVYASLPQQAAGDNRQIRNFSIRFKLKNRAGRSEGK